jgi:uncharacterized membrane protein (DUF2068 family)
MNNSVDQMDLPPVDVDRLAQARPSSQHADGPEDRPREKLRKRPLGVSLIAVLNFGAAALMTLAFVGSLSAGSPDGVAPSGVAFVVAVFSTVIGVGLWKLKKWAYWLTVAGYSVNVLASLVSLAAPAGSGGFSVGPIGVAVACIMYLLQPTVRAAFD